MKIEKLVVPAVAVAAVFALSACSGKKAPQPQAQAASCGTSNVRVIQVQPAQYKYVKVKVKTQQAQYAKIQQVSACDLKKEVVAARLKNN